MSSPQHGSGLLTHDQVKEAAAGAVDRALRARPSGATHLPGPEIRGFVVIAQGDKFLIQELAAKG